MLWTIGLMMRNQYDLVHAHEEVIFICSLLKPIFNFKLIYDMHSSLPEQLINFNFTTSKLIKKLFKKMEDNCLYAADATITICPSLYNYASQIVGDKKKVFLIENSIFEEVRLI